MSARLKFVAQKLLYLTWIWIALKPHGVVFDASIT